MSIVDENFARLEARIRALEAIIQCLPSVVTTDVLERARHEITTRPYRHPDSVVDGLTVAQQQELADDALAEIWRQMNDDPAV